MENAIVCFLNSKITTLKRQTDLHTEKFALPFVERERASFPPRLQAILICPFFFFKFEFHRRVHLTNTELHR